MNLVRFYHHPYRSVNQRLINELFNDSRRNEYDENYLNDCRRKPVSYTHLDVYKRQMLIMRY